MIEEKINYLKVYLQFNHGYLLHSEDIFLKTYDLVFPYLRISVKY